MMHTKGELTIKECTDPQRIGILSERGEICGIQSGVTASGFMPYEVLQANAERLVLCWNCHDELVETCKGLLELAKQALDDSDFAWDSRVVKATKALAKARKEPS